MVKKLEISHRTIVFTVLFLLSLWFLYFIRDILIQIFISLVLVSIFSPFVNKLEKIKVPRALAALLIYLILISAIVASLVVITPALVLQTRDFASSLPKYFNEIKVPTLLTDSITQEFGAQFAKLPTKVLALGVSAFSNVLAVFYVLTISFYLLVFWNKLEKQLTSFFGEKQGKEFYDLVQEIGSRLGSWARGQLLLMFAVGLTTYVGLLLLGVPFALPLAVIAGILEIIPVLGPFIASIPAIAVGLSVSSVTGMAVAALAFLIQQIEIYQ